MHQVYEQITLKTGIQDFIRVIWALSKLVDPDRYRILSYKDFPKKDDAPVVMFRLDTATPVNGTPNVRYRNTTDPDSIKESIGINYQCILTLVAYDNDPMFFLSDIAREMKSTEFYNVAFDKPYLGVTNVSQITPRFQIEDDQDYEESAEMKITFSVQTNVESVMKLYDIKKVLFDIDVRSEHTS